MDARRLAINPLVGNSARNCSGLRCSFGGEFSEFVAGVRFMGLLMLLIIYVLNERHLKFSRFNVTRVGIEQYYRSKCF
jgi:hypothetical protein